MGEPRYTEKEMVMAQREAFQNGAICWVGQLRDDIRAGRTNRISLVDIQKDAHEKYLLPKVERPRVVTDKQGAAWRLFGNAIEFRFCDDEAWESSPIVTVTKDRIALWADLLAHPSEFVDDET